VHEPPPSPSLLGLTPVRQMYLAAFFVAVTAGALSGIFPPFVQASGYELGTVGFLVSLSSVFSLASRLPAGALFTGRRGPALTAAGALLFAASTAAFALTTDLVPLIVSRSLNGLGYGVFTTINLAVLMGAIARPDQRSGITGWYLAWIAAGHALGGYVSGFMVDTLGYGPTFVVGSAAVVLALPFSLVRAPAAPRAPAGPAAAAERPWRAMLTLPLLIPSLQVFSINAFSQIVWVLYPLYGLGVGLSLTIIGLHRGSMSSTGMVSRPLAGQLHRWVSYGQATTWGLVGTAIATMLIPFFTAALPLLMLHVVLGALRSVAMVSSMAAAVEYAGADLRKRGMASGLYHFASDCANVLTPLASGLLADRIGLAPTFWVLPAALTGVYFALLATSALAARVPRGSAQRG
jgi:MFS family permease